MVSGLSSRRAGSPPFLPKSPLRPCIQSMADSLFLIRLLASSSLKFLKTCALDNPRPPASFPLARASDNLSGCPCPLFLKEGGGKEKRAEKSGKPAAPSEKETGQAKPSHDRKIRTAARDAFKSCFGNRPSGRREIF